MDYGKKRKKEINWRLIVEYGAEGNKEIKTFTKRKTAISYLHKLNRKGNVIHKATLQKLNWVYFPLKEKETLWGCNDETNR